MQSFLQHRRFGRLVQQQYERDKHKAEILAGGRHDPKSVGSSSPAASNDTAKFDIRDAENAEHSPSDSEKVEDDGEGQTQDAVARGDPLSRASTQKTRKTMGTALGKTLTGIHVRDRATKEGGDGKVFVVGYEGDNDIMNPHNWSRATRFGATYVLLPREVKAWLMKDRINVAMIGWIVGFASSVDSAA